MKTADAVAEITARLQAAGIEQPRREARLILAAACATTAAGLLALDEVDPSAFETLAARRATREPLAYILGRREFWGLEFYASPATLIPRPDSETLIEAALAALPDKSTITRILDLGTGTGCLLLAALHEFPKAFGVGVDISLAAATLAQRNAQHLGINNRAAFLVGDWAEAVSGQFQLILANPPYIPQSDLPGLMPEVGTFEPRAALDGGLDGLTASRRIIANLHPLLAPHAVAIIELGMGQLNPATAFAQAQGFTASTKPDLAGHPRALILSHK